ncbi:Hypothetical_protein [Hexamita inflata]|uniref:Hypothetical_protein n=1 Tax=Hexamita inflata TaxID=28002 RepID=A0AA86UTA8_9EUKA|nr:Hypothetical protein HINF_LOCUS58440 [Hexamita inflata]
MSVYNEIAVKKSLNDYKAEKKKLKDEQEAQRIKASQIGTQNYYQTEYKNICEKQQQEILELQNKDKKSQQIIQDLQARLNYYMLQQQPVDNVQVQIMNSSNVEDVHHKFQQIIRLWDFVKVSVHDEISVSRECKQRQRIASMTVHEGQHGKTYNRYSKPLSTDTKIKKENYKANSSLYCERQRKSQT